MHNNQIHPDSLAAIADSLPSHPAGRLRHALGQPGRDLGLRLSQSMQRKGGMAQVIKK